MCGSNFCIIEHVRNCYNFKRPFFKFKKMKAPKRIPKEFNYNIPKEKPGTEDRISPAVLKSILESRIGQMEAITLPSEKDKKQILQQINDLPTNSKKMDSFLDFMVNDVINLSYDLYDAKKELSELLQEKEHKSMLQDNGNSKYADSFLSHSSADEDYEANELEERINRIAKKLNVKPSGIENKVSDLLFLKDKMDTDTFEGQDDYQQACKMLNCKPGEMEKALKNLIKERDNLIGILARDNSLIRRDNESLKKSDKQDFSTQSQITINSSSDEEDDLVRPQFEQLRNIRNDLDDLAQQASELSSLYSN